MPSFLYRYCVGFCLLMIFGLSSAQSERRERFEIDGEILTALIYDDDTIFIADLDDVSITSKRTFASKDEQALYMRYRRYANKVYPYAVDAIRIFRELKDCTDGMSRRQEKKWVRRLQKELKEEFEDPLKNLSKTQGRILVHMIEKELDTPIFFLIKDLKGGLTAHYWNTAGKLWGYHLRKGYIVGEDPIMDMVLNDFDISHGD